MTAGLLRERPRFQQRAIDVNGDPLGDWVEPGVTVWARIVPMKGSEPVIQARLQGVQPLSVSIRSSSVTRQITSAWRMVWKGVNYNVKSPPAPDERNVFLNFVAEADQSDG